MKKLAAVISASLLFASSAAMAEVYLGGKVGKSWLDDACRTGDVCDDDSSTAGVFLGYQVLDWLSIEAGYDYLGKFSGAGLDDDKVNVFTLAPKFSVPLAYGVELYAKVGGAYVDYGSEDDYSYLGAAGLEFNTDHNLTFRVEYQAITDINNDLVRAQGNSATLGVSYKFGGSKSEPAPMMVEEVMVEEVIEEPVVVAAETKTIIKSVPFHSLDGSSFAFDSAELTQQSEDSIDKVVTYLNDYPQSKADIVGHTDSTGAAAYNQKLSERRAQAVAEAIIAEGIEPSRITARGEGESKPIATNDTAEGRKLNRRVDVFIPGFEYEETN